MRTRSTLFVGSIGTAALLVAALLSGCGLNAPTQSTTIGRDVGSAPTPMESDLKAADEAARSSAGAPEVSSVPQASDGGLAVTPGTQPMIVSTAGITLEIKNLDAAVAAIRSLATKYGATIANLSVSAGTEPGPIPLDTRSSGELGITPAGATITLRIPAAKLSAAQAEIAQIGRVLSQTSTQDDVTQQHVDMKARLKNLQAEESRLRTFFLKAKRVSEMLAIEQELSRVRGEIESMQAQLTYLERQAAMATLTVSLSEPGALVSPAAGGWGFSQAVRDGIRAAAVVLRALITTTLAFSPLIVLGLILFLVIRALVRRRQRVREREAADTTPPFDDMTPDVP